MRSVSGASWVTHARAPSSAAISSSSSPAASVTSATSPNGSCGPPRGVLVDLGLVADLGAQRLGEQAGEAEVVAGGEDRGGHGSASRGTLKASSDARPPSRPISLIAVLWTDGKRRR